MNMVPRKALERIGFIFVFILCVVGVYFSRTDLLYFESSYVGEDGPLEWLTVVALLTGMIMCIYRARILSPFRNKRFVFCLYFTAFVFFFGLMEEISWGQRIWTALFDFRVPEFFQKYNTQGETNLHNLKFGNFKINKIIFGTFLGIFIVFYFLILPVLYRKVESVKEKVNDWGLPLPKNYHIVAYVSLALLAEAVMGGKKGEILEFGGSWIVLLMLFEPYNRTIFSRKMLDR
ncbi:MAG: hypothetical protein CME63_12925 [Halobacteriovoraceae bacterium]|nr:hypothetical protein [Halobacteriovoraceae bacterium]|tara:strand:+ start:215680 stop:216378 length:699 start_codon:yes stop_codon:yes gene_type:complete